MQPPGGADRLLLRRPRPPLHGPVRHPPRGPHRHDEIWDRAEGALRAALEATGLRLRAQAGRRRLLRPQDRLRRHRLHRPAVAAGHHPARLQRPRALRPHLHRRGQPGAPAGGHPPRDLRLLRALHRHPHRALRRRLPRLAGARAGGGAARSPTSSATAPPSSSSSCAPPACAPSWTTATRRSTTASARPRRRRSPTWPSSAGARRRPAPSPCACAAPAASRWCCPAPTSSAARSRAGRRQGAGGGGGGGSRSSVIGYQLSVRRIPDNRSRMTGHGERRGGGRGGEGLTLRPPAPRFDPTIWRSRGRRAPHLSARATAAMPPGPSGEPPPAGRGGARRTRSVGSAFFVYPLCGERRPSTRERVSTSRSGSARSG